jgi:hypothetical protein
MTPTLFAARKFSSGIRFAALIAAKIHKFATFRIMNRLYTSLIIVAICGTIVAQSPTTTLSKKEQRLLLKEERKKQEAIEIAKTARIVEHMVSRRRFVLEADMLFDRYGQSFSVSPNINFVAVDSLAGVIQIGSSMYIGSNGLGGITIEGKVTTYAWDKNEKRGTYSVNYTVSSSIGTYDVNVTIHSSGSADATVRGAFGGSIRYSGDLAHPAQSKIFKGSSRF